MAALVVTVSSPAGMPDSEGRIGIFPGGATTAMYPAETAFWVGYGFTGDAPGAEDVQGSGTRFELDVDGTPVAMTTELRWAADELVGKTDIAELPDGLPVGWHDFAGRWFDNGRLVLSSRVSVQFVER